MLHEEPRSRLSRATISHQNHSHNVTVLTLVFIKNHESNGCNPQNFSPLAGPLSLRGGRSRAMSLEGDQLIPCQVLPDGRRPADQVAGVATNRAAGRGTAASRPARQSFVKGATAPVTKHKKEVISLA